MTPEIIFDKDDCTLTIKKISPLMWLGHSVPSEKLRPVCFNLVQTPMYTLDLAPTGSGYEKSGRVVQNWNFLINFINFEAELQDSAKKLQC